MDDLKSMADIETFLQASINDLLPYVNNSNENNKAVAIEEGNLHEKSSDNVKHPQYDMIYSIAKENCQLKALLLEIEEAIKKENQRIELQAIYQSLSLYRIKSLTASEIDNNALNILSKEMLAYDANWKMKNNSVLEDFWKNERHYFNININYHSKSLSVQKLTFTTRYKFMCIRIILESIIHQDQAHSVSDNKNQYDYKMFSNFSLKDFLPNGIRFLQEQASAKLFIESYVWPQIDSLVGV